jgi:hypothetical protein
MRELIVSSKIRLLRVILAVVLSFIFCYTVNSHEN